jgi:succinoglycan biosynthesis protein ExoA
MSLHAPPSVDVSVLVPVLNESSTIREAVFAMTGQEFSGTVEFLFADGGSTDDTKEQLSELAGLDPRIRVLENPRGGTASGLNVCLGVAGGRYVARMDAHTLYPVAYLQEGVRRLERGGVAWVAGPQIPAPRGRVGAAVALALGTWLGRGASRRWSAGGQEQEYELDSGVFCGVWRREDVLAHGGWDEDWPRNQDSELAMRFLDAGQRIVCVPSMAARYIPRDSFGRLWAQYRGYGTYRAKTARRHPASLRRSALLPPLLVVDLAVALLGPRLLRRAARAGLAAYAAALGAATLEVARRERDAGAALVPAVLVTMHLAHGVGFVEGLRRWGVPWRALWRVLGGRTQSTPYQGPVSAPSLDGAQRSS